MEINGAMLPGLTHSIIISTVRIPTKQYKKVNGISVDVNIRDVGETIAKLILKAGYTCVSLKRKIPISGRSWELAAYKALRGVKGVYSGTINEDNDGNVAVIGVPGMNLKQQVNENVEFN
jgi:hypothetical protein